MWIKSKCQERIGLGNKDNVRNSEARDEGLSPVHRLHVSKGQGVQEDMLGWMVLMDSLKAG